MVKFFIITLLCLGWLNTAKAQSIGLKPNNTAKNLLIDLEDSIKPSSLLNLTNNKISTKQDSVMLFKTMHNQYKPKQSLPLFCEIEYQLSKLIKRRVKLGVP